MNPQLLVTTIGYGVSILITLGLGTFVLRSAAKREVRIVFFLMSLAVAVFEISHVIGINTSDTARAGIIFFFNLTDIFIGMFHAHWMLSAFGLTRILKRTLFSIYSVGIGLFLFFLVFPETFLVSPVPKMYFKNYYVAGPLYGVMVLYFFCVLGFSLFHMMRAYATSNEREQNRIKYFIYATFLGYAVGSTGFPLVFGAPFNPMLSMFTGFYTIPLAYGIVKYQLMDIRVVIKKAFFYSTAIALISWAFMAIGLLNQWFVEHVPGFHPLLIPVLAGTAAVFIGRLFWRKSKEADLLKYEFITIAAHKLRTPLTRIKWIAELVASKTVDTGDQKLLGEVSDSVDELVELVDIMLETSKEDERGYLYTFKPVDLTALATAVITEFKSRFEKKHVALLFQPDRDIPHISADARRLSAVLHVIIDNALLYTGDGGSVTLRIGTEKGRVYFSVTDTGIGMRQEDIPYIFEKFFRTHGATLIHTEGTGLGLYMVKRIIERHGGTISITSPGEGKGTMVRIMMPVIKE